MRHNSVVRGVFAGIVITTVGLSAAACGVHPSGGIGGAGAQQQFTPTSRLIASGTPTPPAAGANQTGKVTPGQVVLTLDKASYTTSDSIRVTIANGLATAISTTDHQSGCTVVTLERWASGAWQAQGLCRLMTPTRIIDLAPGTTAQQLGATQPGTYRIAFHYFVGSASGNAPTTSQSAVVYSSSFAVN